MATNHSPTSILSWSITMKVLRIYPSIRIVRLNKIIWSTRKNTILHMIVIHECQESTD